MQRLWLWLKYALAIWISGTLLWQSWFLVHIVWWTWNPPQETRFMHIRLTEKQRIQPYAQLNYQWVDYGQISNHLKRAVIAAEDDGFVDHEGFDWDGIEKALEKNQQRGKIVAGGSTITQQLAKNLFLSPSKSLLRKGQEAVITVMIETLWSKRHILEVYLNIVEWGDGTFGAEAAAQRHFGCHASQLNPTQAAKLAVLLPNPRQYEKNYSAWLNAHATNIEQRMRHSEIP